MARRPLTPLQNNVPIVNPDRTPTPQFILYDQQRRQNNEGSYDVAEEAKDDAAAANTNAETRVSKAGDTMTGPLVVPNVTYSGDWNGSFEVPTKDAVYDKVQEVSARSLPAGGTSQQILQKFSDADYATTWSTLTAGIVGFSPSGGLSSTDVQAALVELDSEKASSGSVVTTFTGLTDTPSSYAGNAFAVPRVKSDGSGLEFHTVLELPAGGTSQQILQKFGAGDGETTWSNLTAGATAFTPTGSIASTDVQSALAELDSEKTSSFEQLGLNTRGVNETLNSDLLSSTAYWFYTGSLVFVEESGVNPSYWEMNAASGSGNLYLNSDGSNGFNKTLWVRLAPGEEIFISYDAWTDGNRRVQLFARPWTLAGGASAPININDTTENTGGLLSPRQGRFTQIAGHRLVQIWVTVFGSTNGTYTRVNNFRISDVEKGADLTKNNRKVKTSSTISTRGKNLVINPDNLDGDENWYYSSGVSFTETAGSVQAYFEANNTSGSEFLSCNSGEIGFNKEGWVLLAPGETIRVSVDVATDGNRRVQLFARPWTLAGGASSPSLLEDKTSNTSGSYVSMGGTFTQISGHRLVQVSVTLLGSVNGTYTRTNNWSITQVFTTLLNPTQQIPTLNSPWINYGSGFGGARYYKDAQGLVTIEGLIQAPGGSPTSGVTLFTLLAGYRPADTLMFTTANGGGSGRIDIDSAGNVIMQSGNTAFTSLSGISFYAA